MDREAAVDVAVLGAGVVGLAVAAALARSGRSVVVLERHQGFGRETTSRNSGVIHAGIYYPPDSLKARLCTRGRELLYARCAAESLPHRRLGKLIVATEADEVATLEALFRNGVASGAPGLRMLEAAEVVELEAAVNARAALFSPASGIIDPHALCLSLAAEAERHEAWIALGHEVAGLELADGWRISLRQPDGSSAALRSAAVVNAAGLAADGVAALAGLDLDASGYRLHWCKGDYFSLAPGAPLQISHLVYPVPAPAGLGIHATPDLGGRIRFGPNTEYVNELRYEVDPQRRGDFGQALRRFLPELRDAWLAPDFAGIRPKLAGPGAGFRDFAVREESAAGCPGLVNLIGIESPGLTASLALAERVVALLRAL